MLYKNWPEICHIGNLHFRLAVSLATDEEFLGKIAQVFPNLFTEHEIKLPGPFPLSYLREMANRYIAAGNDHSVLEDPMVDVGLSPVYLVEKTEGWDEDNVLTAPGWFEEHHAYFREEYERGTFPLELFRVQINDEGTVYYLGYVAGDDHPNGKHMLLYPADLVDENK